MELAVKTPGGI